MHSSFMFMVASPGACCAWSEHIFRLAAAIGILRIEEMAGGKSVNIHIPRNAPTSAGSLPARNTRRRFVQARFMGAVAPWAPSTTKELP
jgi:hypothetical protein